MMKKDRDEGRGRLCADSGRLSLSLPPNLPEHEECAQERGLQQYSCGKGLTMRKRWTPVPSQPFS
jgi:hypothetical protein